MKNRSHCTKEISQSTNAKSKTIRGDKSTIHMIHQAVKTCVVMLLHGIFMRLVESVTSSASTPQYTHIHKILQTRNCVDLHVKNLMRQELFMEFYVDILTFFHYVLSYIYKYIIVLI